MNIYEAVKKMGLKDWVDSAKRITYRYSLTHKGRNAKEKACINKGYLVERIGDIFPDVPDCQKNKLGIFALTMNEYSRKGGFLLVR